MIVIGEKKKLAYLHTGMRARQVTRVHRYMAYLCAVCIQRLEKKEKTATQG